MTISKQDFEKTDDQLFLQLADELIAAGEIRLSGPADDVNKRERAKRWLDKLLSELKNSICLNPMVVAYIQDPKSQNDFDIAGVIVDCLTAAQIGIPVGTLTVLIVKGRLQSMCGN